MEGTMTGRDATLALALALANALAVMAATPATAGGPVPDLVHRDGFDRPAEADLRPLSDEFDTPATLGDWRRIWREEYWPADQLEQYDMGATRAGWLTMVPHTSSWYEDYRGELAYKEIAGDFVASARVQARNRAGTGAPGSSSGGPPGSEFSLAGILVRAPREDIACCDPGNWEPGRERYVFFSTGSADETGAHQFEAKTTRAAIPPETHSVSVLQISAASSDEAELRVARIGIYVILLVREPGEDWRVHLRYARADLPETLQVGMTCYTDWAVVSTWPWREHNASVITHAWQDPATQASPDLRAQFDWFRFTRPQVPEELAGLDLADPKAVADAQLLAFLGDAIDPGP
jgi:hypothetical protein